MREGIDVPSQLVKDDSEEDITGDVKQRPRCVLLVQMSGNDRVQFRQGGLVFPSVLLRGMKMAELTLVGLNGVSNRFLYSGPS